MFAITHSGRPSSPKTLFHSVSRKRLICEVVGIESPISKSIGSRSELMVKGEVAGDDEAEKPITDAE